MLKVTVYDSQTFKRKIGSVDISIPSIYYEKDHTINHRWYMLANLDEDFQQIMGYIKLSINLVMAHEKRQPLLAEKPEEKLGIDSIKGLSIPP
jgi:hypothetical protein